MISLFSREEETVKGARIDVVNGNASIYIALLALYFAPPGEATTAEGEGEVCLPDLGL